MKKTVSDPFTAIPHTMLDNIECVNGKVFTLPMVYTYSLIKSFQDNEQVAYFSHSLLQRRLRASRSFVIKMLNQMVEMGLISKSTQERGGTLTYKVLPITDEMIGVVNIATIKPAEPVTNPVEKEDAGSINSASGHQNKPVESTAIIGNLDLDDNGTDIIQFPDVVELTGVRGENDDVCLTVVESGLSAGNEVIEVREAEQAREEKDYGDPW